MKITKGCSQSNSISFCTRKFEATAIRNENGKIEVTIENIEEPNLTQKEEFFANILTNTIMISLILFEILIIKPLIVKLGLLTFFYIFPVIFYIIFLIAAFIVGFVINDNSKTVKKNHGAEHMVSNAYKKLKRIPSVLEVRKFSRFSGSCSAIICSSLIMSHLIAYLIYAKFTIAIPQTIMLILGLDLFKIFPFNFIGLLVQIFTTAKPNDNNIELGIASLCALEYCEINSDKVLNSLEEAKRKIEQ